MKIKKIAKRLLCYFHDVDFFPNYDDDTWSIEVKYFDFEAWLKVSPNENITADCIAVKLRKKIERFENVKRFRLFEKEFHANRGRYTGSTQLQIF